MINYRHPKGNICGGLASRSQVPTAPAKTGGNGRQSCSPPLWRAQRGTVPPSPGLLSAGTTSLQRSRFLCSLAICRKQNLPVLRERKLSDLRCQKGMGGVWHPVLRPEDANLRCQLSSSLRSLTASAQGHCMHR